MSALVAGDVTYSIKGQSVGNFSVKSVVASLTFGDGAKTYPSGGVPLTIGSLGLPVMVQSVDIFDQGTSGYVFSYDSTNGTIRMFNTTASHTHSLYLANAAVADGATTRINAGTNLVGANTGASLTVAGIAAASGAAGGVVNVAAGASSELATSATPAAVTIVLRAVGY